MENRFFILGYGRSGASTARFLCQQAEVWVWDDNPTGREKAAAEGMTVRYPQGAEWAQISDFILSPGIPHTYPTPHPLVAQAKAAGCTLINDIALFFRFFPHIRAIGVTGTCGKSTVCSLIKHVLDKKGIPAYLGGNIGTPVFQIIPRAEEVYVIELSSYQLELLPEATFQAGLIINCFPHHLERYATAEAYAAAKARLLTFSQHKIVGIDTPLSAQMAQQYAGVTSISHQDVGKENFPDNLPAFFKATHNQFNVTIAAMGLRALGIENPWEALYTFTGMPHRQESILTINGVQYINDSKATTPYAVAEALRSLGQQVCWIAGGVAHDEDLSILAPLLPLIQKAFLIGQAQEQFAAFLHTQQVPYTLSGTLDRALEEATQEAQGGGTVLLSPGCASFDQFRDFEHRGDTFRQWVHHEANRAAT